MVRDRAAREHQLARDREARQRETERELSEALAQAKTYLGEGEKQMDNPARWQTTVALAEGAGRGGRRGCWRRATRRRTRRARPPPGPGRGASARQDSDMLVELDRIQLEKAATAAGTKVDGTPYASARAAPRYAALLRDYGVDLAAPAAAERVLSSRLRDALLAALDDWRRVTRDESDRQKLEVMLQTAEPLAGRLPVLLVGPPSSGATVPLWPDSPNRRR